MTKHTPFRDYLIPDETAEPPESGRYAFTALISAVTAIDFDIQAILDALALKSSLGHGHVIADVEGLAGALDSKMPSSRVFRLDDLSDVDGAEGAQEGYVLVKTPTGWIPQSALAAVGNHQHTIAQVFGLSAELAARASLGSNGKVLPEQLPELTTTATVGDALAGASQKATLADSDRFAGILAGASTVFWTTWGNIKTALSVLFVSKAGDTMAGQLTIAVDGGGLKLQGSSNYIHFYDTNNGTRYIHHNDGMLGFLNSTGGWMFRMNDAGQLWTSQLGDFNTYWENRCAAHQNAAVNRCVTSSRMAGIVSVLMNMGADDQGTDINNSGYVITRLYKGQPWRVTIESRQPQLYIPNIGWFAAFPF